MEQDPALTGSALRLTGGSPVQILAQIRPSRVTPAPQPTEGDPRVPHLPPAVPALANLSAVQGPVLLSVSPGAI